jgi:membrane-associated phospholipid phosphatase
MELLANAISITFTIGVIAPAVLFLGSQDFYYVILLSGIIGANALVMGLKPLVAALFSDAEWSRRPAGARDCDALCDGGASGGIPGFPSGHVTTATMCVVGLWLHGGYNPWALWLGVPWIAAMSWARWAKHCHNWQQIVGGLVFGGGCATSLHWLYTHAISG